MSDAALTPDELDAMGMSGPQQAPYGQGYAPPQRTGGGRQRGPSDAAKRVRMLRDQNNAKRQALIDSLQNKVVRANAIGRPDPSLIPMSELAKAGFSSQPNAQGVPYGIDPKSLTPDEMAWLQRPIAALTGGQ